MLKIIGIVIAVLIVAAVLYAITRPDTFHVQRTARIKAASDKIFSHINDLHAWEAWSPYAKLDPAMKTRYSGAASGAGAVYEWEGNAQVGAGRVTISESTPSNRVAIKLEMFKPFAANNDVTFTLQPKGDATDVTWAMDGRNTFMSKLMSLFFSMDKMVGGQFEEGLGNLKTLAERS